MLLDPSRTYSLHRGPKFEDTKYGYSLLFNGKQMLEFGCHLDKLHLQCMFFFSIIPINQFHENLEIFAATFWKRVLIDFLLSVTLESQFPTDCSLHH